MADVAVAQLPGVLEQVRLVAGLRLQTMKNGLRRKSNRWDLIGMIWISIFSSLMVIGLGVAFFVGTMEFLRTNRAGWMGVLFWGLFLWWQIFPIFEAGFGANFEFRTLLRFPMSQRAFYLLGLSYGFGDFAAIAGSCWILAMLLATATTRPGLLPAMAGVGLIFILLNVTLERLLGSWIEKILARRRTRETLPGDFCDGDGVTEFSESGAAALREECRAQGDGIGAVCSVATRVAGRASDRGRGQV